MRKAIVCLLAALCLLPCAALAGGRQQDEISVRVPSGPLAVIAPQAGVKTTQPGAVRTRERDGVCPLYVLPDENSDVLMTYYSGAPLQVIRQSGAEFYQVQIGIPGAGVMGYMHMQDVSAGDAAQRVVAPAYMELQFNREAPVYAFCDEGAQVIGCCETGKTYYAMGKNDDKWVQLYLPPAEHIWREKDRITAGFVRLETGLARGYWHELQEWTVEPRVGEITPQQAIELAVEHLSATGDLGLPEVYTQREELEDMDCRAQLLQAGESIINGWRVYFWEAEESDVVSVYVYADGQGQVQTHHRYYAAGEYPYGVKPTL